MGSAEAEGLTLLLPRATGALRRGGRRSAKARTKPPARHSRTVHHAARESGGMRRQDGEDVRWPRGEEGRRPSGLWPRAKTIERPDRAETCAR